MCNKFKIAKTKAEHSGMTSIKIGILNLFYLTSPIPTVFRVSIPDLVSCSEACKKTTVPKCDNGKSD